MLHNIKVLCVLQGISVRELCKQANVCYESVYNWDSHSPSIDKIVRIAQVLNCTLDDIVFGIKVKEQ